MLNKKSSFALSVLIALLYVADAQYSAYALSSRTASESALADSMENIGLKTQKAIAGNDFVTADKLFLKAVYISNENLSDFLLFDIFISRAVSPDPQFLSHLDKWVATDKSPWIPLLVRAKYKFNNAWKVRGNDYVNKTRDLNLEYFENKMRDAAVDAIRSEKLHIIPYSYALLLNISHAVNLPGLDNKQIFEQAITKFPSFYGFYIERFSDLEPKWNGSIPQLVYFVDTYTARIPANSFLHKLNLELYFTIVTNIKTQCQDTKGDAHQECITQTAQFLSDPSIQRQTKEAIKDMVDNHPYEFNEYLTGLEGSYFYYVPFFTRQFIDWAAAKMGPNQYAVNYAYGYYFYYLNNFPASLKYYNEALMEIRKFKFPSEEEKKRNLALVYDRMAVSYLESGNPAAGINFSRAAVDLKTKNPEYAKHGCEEYFNMKLYADALEYCNKSIEYDGSYSNGAIALKSRILEVYDPFHLAHQK